MASEIPTVTPSEKAEGPGSSGETSNKVEEPNNSSFKPVVFRPTPSSSSSSSSSAKRKREATPPLPPTLTRADYKFIVPSSPDDGKKPRFVLGSAPNYSTEKMSTYEKHLALKDRYGKITSWPNPPSESLENFLERVGYPDKELEGHSKHEHISFFKDLLQREQWINSIAEIGFNAGHSAEAFLSALSSHVSSSTMKMVSFDIMLHPYSFYGKLFIDRKFPGSHTLVAGDSASSVPNYGELHPSHPPFDLIFIDGDHTFERAYCDIYNMLPFANEKTIVVIDNIAPHRGVGVQVYYAYLQAIEDGILLHDKHIEVGDYADGFCVCKYSFNLSPTSLTLGVVPGSLPVDLKHMERRIRICELTRDMENAKTVERLEEIKKEMDELDALGEDRVDQWARELYPRQLSRIQSSSQSWGGRGDRRQRWK